MPAGFMELFFDPLPGRINKRDVAGTISLNQKAGWFIKGQKVVVRMENRP